MLKNSNCFLMEAFLLYAIFRKERAEDDSSKASTLAQAPNPQARLL